MSTVAKGKARDLKASEEPIAYPTLKAAAKAAGLSRQTLAKHLDEIEHRKLDRRVIITRTALERWLQGHNMQRAS